ncbi:hypothetical protein CLV43_12215 [Umezawaea tangerina]|uniref:Uncharacterized protein n=1 Tax=Umezawaea tangerina TaxID=84725 RepID=A0A2T0SDW5_9PSEU|nr:hypothetical protein CLV43_12215 [Umezawaea tangerina]
MPVFQLGKAGRSGEVRTAADIRPVRGGAGCGRCSANWRCHSCGGCRPLFADSGRSLFWDCRIGGSFRCGFSGSRSGRRDPAVHGVGILRTSAGLRRRGGGRARGGRVGGSAVGGRVSARVGVGGGGGAVTARTGAAAVGRRPRCGVRSPCDGVRSARINRSGKAPVSFAPPYRSDFSAGFPHGCPTFRRAGKNGPGKWSTVPRGGTHRFRCAGSAPSISRRIGRGVVHTGGRRGVGPVGWRWCGGVSRGADGRRDNGCPRTGDVWSDSKLRVVRSLTFFRYRTINCVWFGIVVTFRPFDSL